LVKDIRIYAERSGVKAERDKPWKLRSFENDYLKAFACKTGSGIASAGTTAHDKDLSVLLRVRRRKRDEEEKELADLWRVKRHDIDGVGPSFKYVSGSVTNLVPRFTSGCAPLSEQMNQGNRAPK
jgi:hypothetical protein